MRSFFKIFFASSLALLLFTLVAFLILVGFAGSLAKKSQPELTAHSVLFIDLTKKFSEHATPSMLSFRESGTPSLYEVVRLIQEAKTDKNIEGIYLSLDGNANGYAASNELRIALQDFKKSKKFVLAYGTSVSQSAYFIGSIADKVYVNPTGTFEWIGFYVRLPFVKGMLEKLDVQTQIFYAGKYKSATEIFRTDKMTPENRLQTTQWLENIYSYFLGQTAASRGVDTATLYRLAADAGIQTPEDAVQARLIDAVKYDDEVRTELKRRVGIGKKEALALVPINTYNDAVTIRKGGRNKIAVIYAEGDIVDGPGDNSQIGGEGFRALVRKARLDDDVKAIVLRVNSGGGSALASDIIWRELQLARTENKKPVVVSMGDVAASGGYYIACGADSIFANPNTITGSIGVFGIIPNMESFFKNKLGITFDGVGTAPHADGLTVVKPLDEAGRAMVQRSIERIYTEFKQRVATGRKRDTAYIESIAQGRVWSGGDALKIGLVDRLGNLQAAIACAARMAKLDDYGLKEFPEEESWLDTILNRKKQEPEAQLKAAVGEENYQLFTQLKKIKAMTGTVQARLPFEIMSNQ